jgi:hypothetical protein
MGRRLLLKSVTKTELSLERISFSEMREIKYELQLLHRELQSLYPMVDGEGATYLAQSSENIFQSFDIADKIIDKAQSTMNGILSFPSVCAIIFIAYLFSERHLDIFWLFVLILFCFGVAGYFIFQSQLSDFSETNHSQLSELKTIIDANSFQYYQQSLSEFRSIIDANAGRLSSLTELQDIVTSQHFAAIWTGDITTLPASSGWQLCDGTNGMPDLRNRFLIGAGESYPILETGGSSTATLTEDHIPPHNHENGNFRYLLQVTGKYTISAVDGKGPTEPDLVHAAPLKEFGKGKPLEILPPYTAVNFICRIRKISTN